VVRTVVFWAVSIGMGCACIVAGAMKLAMSKPHLMRRGAGWVTDFASGTVKFVGLTELVGGLAIFVSAALNMPARVALTAGTAGLIVVMLGAAVVHARRREPALIVLNFALLALVAVAVWHRPAY
jgi:hypothetical protein